MKKLLSVLLLIAVLAMIPVKAAAAENDGYWVQYNNSWYYYVNGVRATGWIKVNNTWYYMNSSGVMQTGWEKIDNTWYYFAESGAMQTGWQKIGGSWYYFTSGGAMQTGWQKIGANWYYFASGGAMQTGWVEDGGAWYYLNSGGAMQLGWQKISGNWYYLGTNGVMQTGWLYTDALYGYYQYGYYLKPNGAMAVGWEKIHDAWYYFDSNGMQQIGWTKVNGSWYYLTVHGGMVTGWLTPTSGTWQSLGMPDDISYVDSYYFNASGQMVTGKQYIDGQYYTFAASGALQDYKYFLLSNAYFSEWSGWLDPESYTEIDIDKDGSKELIIVSETDYGFYCYEVYGFSKTGGGIVKLEFSEAFANPGTFYTTMNYSSQNKALAIREMNNGSMCDFMTYATRSGDKLVVIGSVGFDRSSGVMVYNSSLSGKYTEISASEYRQILNEQSTIAYSTLD